MHYFQPVSQDPYNHMTDAELLDKFQSGKDKQWLGIVLQRYTLLLLGVCMKYLKNEEEAKDAVQQIFLKALIEMQKYRVQYVKSWLYMVARNHCLMQLRDKQIVLPIFETLPLMTAESDRQGQIEKEATLQLLELSLEELNEEQKSCVTLFYLQKNSYQEIADKTGYSLLQVKSNIQNGKRNLKILVQKKMNSLP